ncbi:MAG: metal-dependent transcriptional regulator [Clostridia bacterium]|nr:metal-dependent transcriptional regulator [Clostridia bacterium]
MRTNESAEMYLEAILILKEKQPDVRAIDVVRYTGYSKPSVSRAMGLLRQNGYVTVEESGFIHLTDEGRALATKVVERHRVLTEFLIRIGVDETVAADDACKIEHDLSDETFEKLKDHLSSMGRSSRRSLPVELL